MLSEENAKKLIAKWQAGGMKGREREFFSLMDAAGLVANDGAPPIVRATVGGRTKVEDRLGSLRKFFPSSDVDPDDPENFIFFDPETKTLTRYNPKGFDVGDIASITREAVQGVGAEIGAILGAGGGAAIGNIPGAVVGASAGGALGAAAGEELYQLALSAAGFPDTRTLAERSKETAAIGSVGLATAPAAVGGAGVREGTKRFMRAGESADEVAEAVSEFGQFGVSPTLAQASRSPTVDAMEAFTARTPGGAGRFRTVVRETMDTVTESVRSLVRSTAGREVDPDVAGKAVKEGVEGFTDAFRLRGGALYGQLDAAVGPESIVPVSKTSAVLRGLANPVEGAANISAALRTPKLAQIEQALGKDVAENLKRVGSEGIPFGVLQSLRSAVGAKLSSFDLVSDIPRGEMKQLYAAISEDLGAAAQAAGPEAQRAFTRANKFWKSGLARIDDLLEPLVSKKTPEAVFKALEGGAKDGPTKARAVMKALNPQQRKIVAATFMQRLVKETPGQQTAEVAEVSFMRFLTNWNNLPRGSKDALFGWQELMPLRGALDALARASGRVKESSQVFANPSGTAGAGIGQAMQFAGLGSAAAGLAFGSTPLLMLPAIIAAASVSANGLARLMTSPRVVRWLSEATTVSANGFAAHVARLGGIAAASDVQTKGAILEYLSVLNGDQAKTEGQIPPTQ